jgi:hypothetical protein
MNKNDDILNYLVEGLIAPQRDLVTRAFYKFAEGDPDSAPVNEAILLTACARRLSLAPRELRDASADFGKLLTEGREMEARIRERVELSNVGVVSEFKDETRRVSATLREIVNAGDIIVDRGKRIDQQLKPIERHLERIGVDLYLLKDDLKDNRESANRTAEAAERIQTIHLENHELLSRFGKESRANWITIGLLAGICLSALFTMLPWWGGSLAFVVAIGLVQWLCRQSWVSRKNHAGKLTPDAKVKSGC